MSAQPEPGGTEPTPRTGDEACFDEYLAMLLTGNAPSPEEFLRARDALGPELLATLERLRLRTAPARARPLERLGEFRILRRLGEGGMGVVFLAEQTGLDRLVALKVLRPELVGSGLAAERFRREARALAQLRHPGIVALHGVGEAEGVRFLVMEHVEGASLAEQQESGALAEVGTARVVRWFAELSRALAHAHAQGVVHRDIKPSNIRITPAGPGTPERALLLDFGLARCADPDGVSLTDTFAGSPAYASPEQIAQSSKVDAKSDVYSLGVTLYRCLARQPAFAGESMEALFHAILAGEYRPLRALAPAVPRDLETVVHGALERDPARRPDALALAEDLEAVLELRPIRSRPPGLRARLLRTLRRHQVASAGVLTAVLSLLAFGGLWLARGRAEREGRAREAQASVVAARAKIAAFRSSREALTQVQRRVKDLHTEQASQFFRAEDYALLDENERKLEDAARGWELAFHEVLDLLRHAERLDPELAGGERVRAELYLERYRQARQAGDLSSAEFYAGLVRRADPEGSIAGELAQDMRVTLRSEPPGAEVFLFRLEEANALAPGGEPRFVAVPEHWPESAAEPGLDPARWCLRVLADAGALRREDLVLSIGGHPIQEAVLVTHAGGPVAFLDRLLAIDGESIEDAWSLDAHASEAAAADGSERVFRFAHGAASYELRAPSLAALGVRVAPAAAFARERERPAAPAEVFRAGQVLALELPSGLDVRATARPLFAGPAAAVGRTPLDGLALPSGQYLALFLLPGHEAQRVPFDGESGSSLVEARLWPLGTTPAGFVYVPPGWGQPRECWLQEHEVTCAQYLEFLNEQETQAELPKLAPLARVPRQGFGGSARPYWEREPDGRFRLPSGWRADWPVVGLSFEDAEAFAAWRTDRARARDEPFVYRLPTLDEFERAALGGTKWSYVYGMRFRAKWSRCCYARPSAHPGPVLEFPVDESLFGVFDLTGGALEWLDGWYDEARHLRHLLGGGWGQADPETLKAGGGVGIEGGQCTGETGLRLLATRREDAR